jgi:hypothetical protein
MEPVAVLVPAPDALMGIGVVTAMRVGVIVSDRCQRRHLSGDRLFDAPQSKRENRGAEQLRRVNAQSDAPLPLFHGSNFSCTV